VLPVHLEGSMGNNNVSGDSIKDLFCNHSHLSVNQVTSLYSQYNEVLNEISSHSHKFCYQHASHEWNIITKSGSFEIFAIKLIGYYKGDVAFIISQDPVPYVLFEVGNPNFRRSLRTLQSYFQNSTKVKNIQSYNEIISVLSMPNLELKLLEVPEKQSYGQFHWVATVFEV
jgi:hypothetical protein